MKSIVFIALFISFALSASYQFAGNVSLNNDEADFKFRSLLVIPQILGYNGFLSVSVDAKANQNGGTAALDVIAGGLLFNTLYIPTTYMGFTYLGATAYVDVSTGTAGATFDGSSSFIVTSYISIVERSPNNVDVRTLNLKGLFWSTSHTQTGDLLTYQTSASGFTLNSGESIQFDFLTSQSLGSVDAGVQNVAVSPRTLESIVRINGWKYASNLNKLVLKIGTITGAGNAQATANVAATGSGNKQVYIQFSENAEVNGALTSVSVKKSGTAIASVSDYSSFTANAQAVYSAQVQGNIFEVSFPPGASSIVYDPTMGSGPIMSKNSGAAIFVAFFAVVIALLA